MTTPTTQREADERAEACMQIAHRWAQAAYCKALNMPGEDIDRIKRELRAAIDQSTRQAAPEALALTEAETRLMARLRAASGSGATPWVDLLTEIDDPHMVDFDELTMLACILERTIRQAAPEELACPTCKGFREVLTDSDPAGEPVLAPCPACVTAPEGEKHVEYDAVSTMLWLYRRLPRGYERPPNIENPIRRLARVAGFDLKFVEDSFAERAATPSPQPMANEEKDD